MQKDCRVRKRQEMVSGFNCCCALKPTMRKLGGGEKDGVRVFGGFVLLDTI